MRKIYYSLLAISGLVFLTNAYAYYYRTSPQPLTANLEVTIPRDLPIGTLLGSGTPLLNSTFAANSLIGGSKSAGAYGILISSDPAATTADGKNIYAIPNVPGIGYAIGINFQYAACNSQTTYWVGTNTPVNMLDSGNTNSLLCWRSNWSDSLNPGIANVYLNFYKIGQVVPTDTSLNFRAGLVLVRGADGVPNANYFNVTGSIKVKPLTCKIRQQLITLPLDPITFNTLKGKGTAAGGNSFSISADSCDAQLKVGIILDAGTRGSDDPTNGVLNPETTSTSEGVGIQLLYGGNPVSLGQVIPRVSSTTFGQSITTDFTARYFQTGLKRKAGTVNASAIYTMSYE